MFNKCIALFLFISTLYAQPNFEGPAYLSDDIFQILGRDFREQNDPEFSKLLVSKSLELKSQDLMTPAKIYNQKINKIRLSLKKGLHDTRNEQEWKLIKDLNRGEKSFLSEQLKAPQLNTQGAGSFLKILKLAEKARIDTEKRLNQSSNPEERERLQKQLDEILASNEELTILVQEGVGETIQSIEELSRDLEKLVTEIGSQSDRKSVKQIIFLKESLFSEDSLENRIAQIDNQHGPYYNLSAEKKEELKKTLRKQEKIKKNLNTMNDGLVAAQDTLRLMNRLGIINDEDTTSIEQGLAITGDALQIATGLASGNIFMAISGVSNLIMHIMGEEPRPDPDQVRHEQVIKALDQLQKGQIKILKTLGILSNQIRSQFQVVFSVMKEIKEISKTSMDLIIEGRLKGLRDCEQFIEDKKYYSDELGFLNYQSFKTHFQINRSLYASCVDFINDQIRGEGLNLMTVATNAEEAREIEKKLKKPRGWVNAVIDNESHRYTDYLRFMDTVIKPKYHKAILGAMTQPSFDMDELESKLNSIAKKPRIRKYWERQFDRYQLNTELKKFYNTNLVLRISHVSENLLAQKLLYSHYDDEIYSKEDILKNNFDPIQVFGGNRNLAIKNYLSSVTKTGSLLSRSIAQNTLYSGELFIPFFSLFTVKATLMEKKYNRPPKVPNVIYLSEFIVGKNPILFENSIRYLFRLNQKKRSDLDLFNMLRPFLVKRVETAIEKEIKNKTYHDPTFKEHYSNLFRPLTQQQIEALHGDLLYEVEKRLNGHIDMYNNLHINVSLRSQFADPSKNSVTTLSRRTTTSPQRRTKKGRTVTARLPTPKEIEQGTIALTDDLKDLLLKRYHTRGVLIKSEADFIIQENIKMRRSLMIRAL